MHFSRVLLPEPFSPMKPKVSPAGISNETSSSAANDSYLTRARRITAPFNELLRSW